MNTVTLWLLIAAVGSNYTSPTNIVQFATEKDCLATAATMERLSNDKPKMARLFGVCVEAKVVRP